MLLRLCLLFGTLYLLTLNFHPSPKSYVVLNFAGSWFCFRVIPRRVFVDLAVYYDVVVTCGPFLATNRMSVALLEVFVVNRTAREVLIAFNLDCLIAFS